MPKLKDMPSGLPLMPTIDPLFGDKTPAVVEWFRDYWPEEFELRYRGRKTHLGDRRWEKSRQPIAEAAVRLPQDCIEEGRSARKVERVSPAE